MPWEQSIFWDFKQCDYLSSTVELTDISVVFPRSLCCSTEKYSSKMAWCNVSN